jgi:hypothetical protein
MGESVEQKTARLMAAGLDHYGQDRVEEAVSCWREVVALNPGHRVAHDYLEAAGFSATRAAAPDGGEAEASGNLVDDARVLIAAGGHGDALELLETRISQDAADLEAQALTDLVRSHLFHVHRERVSDGSAVPGVRLGPDEILKFNLPANAGFVLSMIDGVTSVDDLVTLSGMDPFEALHLLVKLMDVGIVDTMEVRA